jgi:hypothetical protein
MHIGFTLPMDEIEMEAAMDALIHHAHRVYLADG